jgi:hypothetical protein
MTETRRSTIELNVHGMAQLFESLDPYPFRERDLDRHAEEFIVGWARDLPRDHALEMVVHMPSSELQSVVVDEIAGGMKRFFAYRADGVTRDLRELFRVGRMSLLIGMVVLVACVVAAQNTEAVLGEGPFATVTHENLIILGWVANWRPLEIFLYEWWPVAQRRGLYRRLAAADVSLRPA